ncbi:HAD family hydrolase [Amaricoccus sp.]|uniref:HAD family hydrolase n=1 Tax=Amaricoccus sp. TaxID=1872485 RepID=UPI001B3F1D92|nr:HAD family hydrolase [Amaricoccus sp.]MBP7240936.1 haloacid dehalogenase-like hydrolase [Amaricoccus sp.]
MLRLVLAFLAMAAPAVAQTDPLPSWNDSDAKTAILDFVAATADPASPSFVEPGDRIATFDNDGTLWSEQPLYFQFLYVLDKAKQLAAADPAWAATPVLKAAAAGDVHGVIAGGMEGLVELFDATGSGTPVEAFRDDAARWLATAKHPEKDRLLVDMIYQPMVELLEYLRASGYQTFIVSGGGIEFIRAFAEEEYGIPPPQVVGSEGELDFEMVDGAPQVMREKGVAFVDDGPGKPVGIARHIGQRPIFVAGNSDGDLEMLQWGTAGDGARMGIIVHHTDAAREWAYDRDSHIGRLDKALDLAPAEGWIVVDMARDWGAIWPDAPAQ